MRSFCRERECREATLKRATSAIIGTSCETALELQLVRPFFDLAVGFVFCNPVAFLNATFHLVAFARNVFNIIVSQVSPLLTDLTCELLPVPCDAIPKSTFYGHVSIS